MPKPRPLPDVELLRALFRYDPKTGLLYWRTRPDATRQWNRRYARRRAGSIIERRRRITFGAYKQVLAYRIIWKMVYGDEPEIIDHVDGNPLNDRLCNLRVATHQENARNARRCGNSGFKGVTYDRRLNRWLANIHIDGRRVALGSFHCAADAHEAYVRAAKRHFGAFARVD